MVGFCTIMLHPGSHCNAKAAPCYPTGDYHLCRNRLRWGYETYEFDVQVGAMWRVRASRTHSGGGTQWGRTKTGLATTATCGITGLTMALATSRASRSVMHISSWWNWFSSKSTGALVWRIICTSVCTRLYTLFHLHCMTLLARDFVIFRVPYEIVTHAWNIKKSSYCFHVNDPWSQPLEPPAMSLHDLNPWNTTPVTLLQLAEDLGAAPIWVFNNGTCNCGNLTLDSLNLHIASLPSSIYCNWVKFQFQTCSNIANGSCRHQPRPIGTNGGDRPIRSGTFKQGIYHFF